MQVFMCGKGTPTVQVRLDLKEKTLERFKEQTKLSGVTPKQLMEYILDTHKFEEQQSCNHESKGK